MTLLRGDLIRADEDGQRHETQDGRSGREVAEGALGRAERPPVQSEVVAWCLRPALAIPRAIPGIHISIVLRCYRKAMVLRDADYEDLLALRTGLRRFLRWSEQQAEGAGLTPAQHQLLLAIRGHSDHRGPTVGEVADYLLLRHHSAVGLVDRADAAKLVKRVRDPQDHRVVRLQLTAAGSKRLEALSEAHLEELGRLGRTLPSAWRGLMPRQPLHGIESRV
jgi:DNA-binding MarR family transcriptional regulator